MYSLILVVILLVASLNPTIGLVVALVVLSRWLVVLVGVGGIFLLVNLPILLVVLLLLWLRLWLWWLLLGRHLPELLRLLSIPRSATLVVCIHILLTPKCLKTQNKSCQPFAKNATLLC